MSMVQTSLTRTVPHHCPQRLCTDTFHGAAPPVLVTAREGHLGWSCTDEDTKAQGS